MFDILFLAIISGLIFTKLFKTLGKVDEHDVFKTKQIIKDIDSPKQEINQETELEIQNYGKLYFPPHIKNTIEQLYTKHPSFSLSSFVNGAKKAFMLIIDAFYQENTGTLQALLNREVLTKFIHEINRRKEANEYHSNTIIKVQDCKIVDIQLNNNILNITVEFISEQIHNIKDSLGNIISGSIDKANTVHDTWTFSKHLNMPNSIWQLVETKHK